MHGRIQRSGPPPPENSQKIRFLSNTGPDPLKNHKATKPALVFRWRADSGPILNAGLDHRRGSGLERAAAATGWLRYGFISLLIVTPIVGFCNWTWVSTREEKV